MKWKFKSEEKGNREIQNAAVKKQYAAVLHLVHAGLVESHYGCMGQPVKHSAQSLLGVKFLRLEKLLQELFVEHGGDDVIHN